MSIGALHGGIPQRNAAAWLSELALVEPPLPNGIMAMVDSAVAVIGAA